MISLQSSAAANFGFGDSTIGRVEVPGSAHGARDNKNNKHGVMQKGLKQIRIRSFSDTETTAAAVLQVHDRIPELGTLCSLQSFRHVVAFNVICWAVFDNHVALLHLVGNEETPIVNVPGPLSDTFDAIVFQSDGAFIVLEDNAGFNFVALFVKKILDPQYV